MSTSGSDSASGLTDGTAWRTLQKAATSVRPGDTVTVRPGTYAGLKYTGTGGTASAPITFKADPGVLINNVASGGNAGFHFEGGSPGYFVIDGFKIDGSNGSMPKAGIRLIQAHHFTLRNNDISNPGGYWGIFISNSTDGQVLNNKAHDSGTEHGIYLSGSVHRTTVRGNAFYNNNADGIHTNAYNQPGPQTGNVIDGNTIYGNGLSGMDIEGLQDSTVTNNVVYANGKHGISVHYTDNLPNFPSRNNLFANNTIVASRFAIQLNEGESNNYLLNNVLVSTSTGNYGALGVTSTSGLVSDYNAVSDSFSTNLGASEMTLASWRSQSGGDDQHSFVASPSDLFVNPGANDYRLKAGSPAIDRGSGSLPGASQTAPVADRDGARRPQGATWDVGAYEYAGSTPPPATDTTAPTISSVASSSVTTAGATITWATNEASDTQVEYGTTTSYGTATTLNTAPVTAHSASLAGLAAGTLYHYRVKSRDAAGNLAVSGDFTLTTAAAPVTPPPAQSTVFSAVPTFGDFASYNELNSSRWTVADDGSGNTRLFLNTTGYNELDASRLGEMARVDGRTFGDFDITLKARTGDSLAANTAADYAVVFGYVDASNYSYLMMNATTGFTKFISVANGVATSYGTATSAGIPDAAFHDVKVTRRGSTLTASVDGQQVITATNAALGLGGTVGVGSFNDSAYFDDVNAIVPAATPVPDTTAPAVTARTPAAGATVVAVGGNVSITFDEAIGAGATLALAEIGGAAVPASVSYDAATRTLVLNPTTDLKAGAGYTATLSGVKDAAGNAAPGQSWSFSTADVYDDFAGTALDSGWTSTPYASAGTVTVAGGTVSVGAAQVRSGAVVGRSVEGRVRFTSKWQAFGLGTDLSTEAGNTWAFFGTKSTADTLYARTNVNGVLNSVRIGATPVGLHTYRVEATASGFDFYVDDAKVTTIAGTLPTAVPVKLVLSDMTGSSPLVADWVRTRAPSVSSVVSTVLTGGA